MKLNTAVQTNSLSRKRGSGSEDAGQQPEEHCPFVLLAGCKYSYITLELGKTLLVHVRVYIYIYSANYKIMICIAYL